jgi:PAS domain S-box-containing protein
MLASLRPSCYATDMSLCDMIESSPVAALITYARKPDNPIIACNDAFLALTGYAREEIIGRNCRFLTGPETDPQASATLRDGIGACQPVLVELLNYRKDGTAFRNAVMIAPIFDESGEVEYFIGSQVAVPDRANGHDTSQAQAKARVDALSPRQRQVLVAMASGKSSKQIAYDFGLSERTIKMHRSALLRALRVRAGVEAIRIAIEAGY